MSSNKRLIIFVGVIFVFVVAWIGSNFILITEQSEVNDNRAELTYSQKSAPIGVQTYDADEVSRHSTKDDCWLVINNKIYDVSDFQDHPGGDYIYQGCGKDATNLFETRTMGSGTPHSQISREKVLPSFYIAEFTK